MYSALQRLGERLREVEINFRFRLNSLDFRHWIPPDPDGIRVKFLSTSTAPGRFLKIRKFGIKKEAK